MSQYDIPEDWSHSALAPEGVYLVEVGHVEEGRTKAGDAKIMLFLRSVETGDDVAVDTLTISKKAAGLVKNKLIALGIVAHDAKGFSFDAQAIRGRRAWVKVKHEVYNEQTYARVDIRWDHDGARNGYIAEDSYTPAPMDDDEATHASGPVPF